MTTLTHPARTDRRPRDLPRPSAPLWLRRAGAALWLNTVIGAVVALPFVTGAPEVGSAPLWPTRVAVVFAVWVLSFAPGWLYLRFLHVRLDGLWTEFVLNLYRLGVDDPAWLPPAPVDSVYRRLPGAASGGDSEASIYRQKFDSFHGRGASAQADDRHPATSVDNLFPVVLCTATFAVAWTLVLADPSSVLTPHEPWAVLVFGFLGAYAFAVSTLVRRFYQSDLRPSAYTAVVVRLVVVLLVLAVVHQLLGVGPADVDPSSATQYVVAFVVGFFPLAGLQAVRQLAATALHVVVPSVVSNHPLDRIDGLNVWYEARLAEEGVEDMQNLVTTNLVDVVLHTRAPVGRIVDWIDQAFLLVHVPAFDSAGDGAGLAAALHRAGIRSATDLLRACGDDGTVCAPAGVDPTWVTTTCRLLAGEPGLAPVWNWRAGAAPRIERHHP